jgi:molybdenum cofactor cytidylyltransferase
MSAQKQCSGVTAVVLAAGMSRRMGAPKQLLRMEGKTILGCTLENVRKSAADEIILVLGFAADAVENEISTGDIKVVRNNSYQQGMGSSLRTGLAALSLKANAALIVLADQPFVRAATLDKLIECHQASKPQIIIPMYKGFRGNPVLLDRSVFPELKDLSGDVGCRAIFGNHAKNIHKLSVEDAGILLDIDNQDDFQKLCGNGIENNVVKKEPSATLESKEDMPVGRPELVLVGSDAIVQALVKFGHLLKFTVTVVDPFLSLSELPEADRVLHALDFSQLPAASERYAVVASRGQFDEEAVTQALHAGISYIAIVATKKRAQELAEILLAQSIAPERLTGIRAPAGLEIGADTSEEIALSIMAEIVEVHRRQKRNKP